MAFLAAAAPFAAAGASLVKGVGGFMAGQANKKNAFAQAREERLGSAENERELRRDARRGIGTQLASQWGNGMEGGSGTALEALRESEMNAALDAAEIRRQGAARSKSLRAQGKQAGRQGYFDLAGGILGAADSYSGMSNDWAQAKRGTSAPGGGGGDRSGF